VLASGEVLENAVESNLNPEHLGEAQIKGREKPVDIFKLA